MQSLLEHANLDPLTYNLSALASSGNALLSSVNGGGASGSLGVVTDSVANDLEAAAATAHHFMDLKPSQMDLYGAPSTTSVSAISRSNP